MKAIDDHVFLKDLLFCRAAGRPMSRDFETWEEQSGTLCGSNRSEYFAP
jgi:hypothetical protein